MRLPFFPWSHTAAGGKMSRRIIFVLSAALLSSFSALAQTVIRVGAFPNITHPQAMVGKANGWFEKQLGPNVKSSGQGARPIAHDRT
jgi:ABC-type nitrate/sulfonate/bicarbonate transport system substrate-binding protein